MIIVSDPRPTFEQGTVDVYGFGVLEAIPKVTIPLAGEEAYILDFGQVYNRVFESLRLCQLVVDYEQVPVNFEGYSSTDQGLIREQMETLA